MPEMTMVQALNLALRQEMRKDDRVIVLGEDVGRDAGGMIAEGALAVEMGALADDVALTVHPHPTLSETEAEAFEAFLGSATHILPKRR